MTELLLLALAVGHYAYEPVADMIGADVGRVFYVFQGAIGCGFFVLGGLAIGRRKWPDAAKLVAYLVALAGLAEQTLVAACGCARMYDPVFRAPRGEGLCGSGWYGVGLAVVAWLAVVVYTARKARHE